MRFDLREFRIYEVFFPAPQCTQSPKLQHSASFFRQTALSKLFLDEMNLQTANVEHVSHLRLHFCPEWRRFLLHVSHREANALHSHNKLKHSGMWMHYFWLTWSAVSAYSLLSHCWPCALFFPQLLLTRKVMNTFCECKATSGKRLAVNISWRYFVFLCCATTCQWILKLG